MSKAIEIGQGKELVCLTLRNGAITGAEVNEGEVIGIVRGEKGYTPTTYGHQNREWINDLNHERFGITPEQESAYSTISVLGLWNNEEEVLSKLTER